MISPQEDRQIGSNSALSWDAIAFMMAVGLVAPAPGCLRVLSS